MKKEDISELNVFLENVRPEFREIAQRLHSIVQSVSNRLQYSIKWKKLTYAIDGDFHHWVCAISITKSNVGLVYHFGGLLNDERHLLIKGDSKFFRKIEIKNSHNIDEDVIREFLLQAIDKLPYFIENWKEIQGIVPSSGK